MKLVSKFLNDQSGATAKEYRLIAAASGASVVILTVVAFFWAAGR